MTRKPSQRLHLLQCLKRFSSHEELHMVYTGMVRSLYAYYCPSFVKIKGNLDKCLNTCRLEKRAHRLIYDDDGKDSSCELDGVRGRREKLSKALFLTICSDGKNILFSRLPGQLVHRNRFRNPYCRTSLRQHSFIPFTTLCIPEYTLVALLLVCLSLCLSYCLVILTCSFGHNCVHSVNRMYILVNRLSF